MPLEIPKQYAPADAQDRWIGYWEEQGYFDANPNPDKKSHTIMIPLPNVTGALHMGHALNGTLQDLITRWRRMQGYEALWMPGTDHAGIATQAVVERRMLQEEGLTRHDIGREALVNRIWKWKDAYQDRILNQLKQLGASCDWRRTRFTLDDVCSKAVRRTFFKLFKDELIYRGKRLVNWDTFLQTAVANDEVFEEEIDGHFWTFTYPVVDDAGNETDEKIAFSTTRPETMLGDTAVCVHPTDERYTDLVGKKVKIPLNGRLIPIIADALLANKELGTGAVKVTPGHDPNDYACYQRNPEIGIIDLLNFDGTVTEVADNPKYVGIDRLKVREMVVDDMSELGFYDGVEDRKISLKHSDRSKTPIEPMRSDQWFVKMDDHDDGSPGLAQTAIDAVNDGRVTFYPSRYAKTYLDWLGEKRDWCISRQLWWGHRIPVWRKKYDLPQKLHLSANSVEPKKRWTSRLGMDPQRANDEIREQLLQCLGQGDPIMDAEAFAIYQTDNDLICGKGIGVNHINKTFSHSVCLIEEAVEAKETLERLGYTQDPDVLDTWFSSALWPHSTLGWPDLEHDPPLDENQGADAPRSPENSHGAQPVGLNNPKSETHNSQSGDAPRSPDGNQVLPYFYPGSVLVTSRDIITLWVARMVLTGLYNMGDVPFQHVCVHPKILDGFGQTMSKSKGNGVDPMDLIEKYGTDAIRFTIASFAGETQDVRLPTSYECPHCEQIIPQKLYPTEVITYIVPESLEGQFPVGENGEKPRLKCPNCKKTSQFSTPAYDPDANEEVARVVSERFEKVGRNFCNKLWNASRFALLNLEDYTPGTVAEEELHLEDRWILSRLSSTAAELNALLSEYKFDAATRAIREFTWNEFCDWYLEMIKPRLRDESLKPAAQRVLVGVLDSLLRLLSPFIPFITEELWQRLKEVAPSRGLLEPESTVESIMIAAWPEVPDDWQDSSLEGRFEQLQEMIVSIRNVRANYNIPPSTPLKLHVRCSAEIADELQSIAGQFENLAKIMLAAVGPDIERPTASANFTLGNIDGFIPLEDIIDLDAERDRLKKEAEKISGFIAGHQKKLTNVNFVDKAPAEVVQNVRDTLADKQTQLQSIEEAIHLLHVN